MPNIRTRQGKLKGLRISPESVETLSRLLGHDFQEPELLDRALTHSSAKTARRPSNERMEFFGDAVIGLIVTELVFHQFPDYPEGEMTRLKSALVSRETLAEKALDLGLQYHVIIGKGVGSRDDMPKSILANLFEAVIAALYMEAGYEKCRTFLIGCFQNDVGTLVGRQFARNYKSALQQLAQSRLGVTPTYSVLGESGPDHDKRFTVAAILNDREYGIGQGQSKKEAEQTAARIALKELLSSLDLGDDEESLLMELPDEEADADDFFDGDADDPLDADDDLAEDL